MVVTASRPVQVSSCYQNHLSRPYQGHSEAEVPKKSARRCFTAEYKLRILREADTCSQKGQIGALLRREDLCSSHLTTWRRQRQQGQLQALTDNKRGRRTKAPQSLQAENERLRQENQRLAKRLEQAKSMLDTQKKASEILLEFSLAVSRFKSDENSCWR